MRSSERIFALVIAQGFNAIVNFLFLPYLVRALNRDQYGLYGQVLMISDTARTLFSMGTATVLYVTLARAKDQHSEFKTLFVTSFAQGAAGALAMLVTAGIFARNLHSEQLGTLLKIYCAYQIFYIPYLSLFALLIFLGRVRDALLLTCTGLLLRVAIVVSAVQYFHALSFIFGGLVLLGAIQLAMGLSLVPRHFLTKGRFNLRTALTQLTLGVQLGFTGLMVFLIGSTDDYMVSTFLNVRDFAVYRNGTMEIPIIGTLYTSIASIILPSIVKLYAAGNFGEIVRLKRKLITSTAAVIYPVVFFLIIFSQALVVAYFSKLYAETATVFAIMCVALLTRVNDFEDIVLSASRSRILVITETIAFVFNFVLTWVLIHRYGYLGAAFSTVLTRLLTLAVLFFISARLIGRSWTEFLDFKKLTTIVGVSVSLPLLLRLAMNGTEGIALVLICGAISVSLTYLIFLKTSIMDYHDLSSLVAKVPGIGGSMDRFFSRLFTPQDTDHDISF